MTFTLTYFQSSKTSKGDLLFRKRDNSHYTHVKMQNSLFTPTSHHNTYSPKSELYIRPLKTVIPVMKIGDNFHWLLKSYLSPLLHHFFTFSYSITLFLSSSIQRDDRVLVCRRKWLKLLCRPSTCVLVITQKVRRISWENIKKRVPKHIKDVKKPSEKILIAFVSFVVFLLLL
jgi:hypothetical protein